MKRGKSKKVILLCLGLLSVILGIWTAWGNKALMVKDFGPIIPPPQRLRNSRRNREQFSRDTVTRYYLPA